MTNPEDATHREPIQPPPGNATQAATGPPAGDAEMGTGGGGGGGGQHGFGLGVGGIARRWKRDDLVKRGSLVLRGLALLFALLGFLIMVCNKHGDHNDWRNFDKYEEYRYLVGITVIATLYTGFQALRYFHEISTKKSLFERRTIAMVDFIGDQVAAYLLMSAASSAIPLTNRMREGSDNIFTDSSAAAISMTILGFLTLALSAVLSGYKLSTQTYI